MSARIEEHTATVEAHGLALTAAVECVVIACDGCEAPHATPGSDEGHATQEAAAAGWTWDGGTVDGCPRHPVAADDAPDATREGGR